MNQFQDLYVCVYEATLKMDYDSHCNVTSFTDFHSDSIHYYHYSGKEDLAKGEVHIKMVQ
jgi:hypothetical protein